MSPTKRIFANFWINWYRQDDIISLSTNEHGAASEDLVSRKISALNFSSGTLELWHKLNFLTR